MTDQTSSDLLMKFTKRDGDRTVWAESMLDIFDDTSSTGDVFLKDFVPASSLDDYSNFFEISSFGIALAAKPREDQKKTQAHDSKKLVAGGTSRVVGGEWNTFYRWATQRHSKSASPNGLPQVLVDFDQFSFSRIIDGASPDFFQACCDQVSFKEAVLVKRVSTGLQGGDKRQSMGYLKFVFSDVLLTSFGWDDGELITENCTFICKKMTLNYRQQDADGTLGAAVGELTWQQRTDERIKLGQTVNRNGNG
jgi:type VI protein secretion system component Hcp